MWKAVRNSILFAICASLATDVVANTCSLTTSEACGTVELQGITSAQQAELLHAHNSFRSYVAQGLETRGGIGAQPAASNMRLMSWDDELAILAQSWANNCTFAHNLCGGSSRFSIGQNLYALIAGKVQTVNMTKGTESWYDEVKLFNSSSINPFQSTASTGHYTQVAWDSTYLLGCGMTAYRASGATNVWHVLVCNYGPAGNVVNGVMYETGTACSSCGTNLSCSSSYTGLCA